MEEQDKKQLETEREEDKEQENPMIRKRLFGRGIYGSKDVPIRLLDGLIAFLMIAIVGMIAYFAFHGGYTVTFDSQGGTEVKSQKLKYGDTVAEPEDPVRQGYEFAGWYIESGALEWYFPEASVEGDITLYAHWIPAKITVKFDLDGGNIGGEEEAAPVQVTFEDAYGKLPVPEKEGYQFAGWSYSGQMIESSTIVTTNGEHVLTAVWE